MLKTRHWPEKSRVIIGSDVSLSGKTWRAYHNSTQEWGSFILRNSSFYFGLTLMFGLDLRLDEFDA